MARTHDDDGLDLVIEAGEERLTGVNAVIPETWWFTSTGAVTENLVCLREQMIAEILMVGGLL
jgi:hypothetical protein